MKPAADILDSRERGREKQVSRDIDAARLQSGDVSNEDLTRENGFFAALPVHEFRIVAVGKKRLRKRL